MNQVKQREGEPNETDKGNYLRIEKKVFVLSLWFRALCGDDVSRSAMTHFVR
jgi:hypothetical protein